MITNKKNNSFFLMKTKYVNVKEIAYLLKYKLFYQNLKLS